MVREAIILMNIVFSFLALYPAIHFGLALWRERNVVETKIQPLNTILNIVVFGFIMSTMINMTTSIASITSQNGLGHTLSPYTRAFFSGYTAVVMWLIYLYKKRISK